MPSHRSLLAALLALSIPLSPSFALAQDDFDFGDGTDSDADMTGDSDGEGGDDFDFGDGSDTDTDTDTDMGDGEGGEDEVKTLAVVAIPSSNLDAEQRATLQSALMRGVQIVKKYNIEGDDKVLPELDLRGPEECVKEPICLANAGEDAGADLLLVGRIVPEGSAVRLTIDLFDTREKLFLASDKSRSPRDLGGAMEDAEPLIKNVFEIRELEEGPIIEDDSNAALVQSIFAYSTAGLAVACIGGGIVFGLDAQAQSDAVVNAEKNDAGRYTTQTQAQAQQGFQNAQATATTANVFFGLGVALAATSAALFVIDFGGDVASEGELNDRRRSQLRVAPAVSPDGVGAAASFRF